MERRRMMLDDLMDSQMEYHYFRGMKANASNVEEAEGQMQISLANVDGSFRGCYYSCLDVFVVVLDWLLMDGL